MNRKSIISGLLIVVFLTGIASTPAAAGSRERGRFEGFALGLGAAFLGHSLMHHYRTHQHYKAPIDRHPPRRHHHHPKHYHHRHHGYHKPPVHRHGPRRHFQHRRGHWEFQRVWVPPTYKKVWQPGYYNRRGRWIPGCWVKEPVSRGYWEKRKVWVAGSKRPGRAR